MKQNNEQMFIIWLKYIQVMNDIETLQIYSYTKKLLGKEKQADKRTQIINKHLRMYNIILK